MSNENELHNFLIYDECNNMRLYGDLCIRNYLYIIVINIKKAWPLRELNIYNMLHKNGALFFESKGSNVCKRHIRSKIQKDSMASRS